MSEQRDKELLRRAIALSEEAVASGGRPFGAVICDGEGQIVAEARSVARRSARDLLIQVRLGGKPSLISS